MLRRRGVPLMAGLAAASPGLALGHAIGRIGCFLVGDDYGRPERPAVGGCISGRVAPRPTCRFTPHSVYEMAALIPLAWPLIRWCSNGVPDRVVFGRYLRWLIQRFAIEFVAWTEPVALPTLAHLISSAGRSLGSPCSRTEAGRLLSGSGTFFDQRSTAPLTCVRLRRRDSRWPPTWSISPFARSVRCPSRVSTIS